MAKRLTAKQEAFCLEYSRTGNIVQSALSAGYSQKFAEHRAGAVLDSVVVRERLKELNASVRNKQIADIAEMQEILTKIIRQTAEEECLLLQGVGEGRTEIVSRRKTSALKDVTKAIELLGKMQGAFTDHVEVDVVMPVFSGEDDLAD